MFLRTLGSVSLIALALVADAGGAARAAEGQVFGGPTGGTDVRNAYISQTPGFAASFVFVDGVAGANYNQYGSINPAANVRTTINAAAVGIAYVYPFKILNADASSFVQANYQFGSFALNGQSESIGSLGDPYVEFLALGWRFGRIFSEGPAPTDSKLPYGLAVKAAYSMLLPLGYYSSHQLITPGHNDYFIIPNVAVTYLFGPNFLGDGLELDAHLFLDIATRNPATDYYTGIIADTDFAVSERTGNYQYGLAGYYARQLQHDTINGLLSPYDGKVLEQFYLGPVFAYDIPSIGSTVKAKIQIPVEVHNGLNTVRSTLSWGVKF